MEDEELKYGMTCRFLREEIVSMEPGGRVLRNLVRTDGLKHRNITCAFLVHRDAEPESAYNGTLVVRCFGVCCESTLTFRVRLQLRIGSEIVRSQPWQDGIQVRYDTPAVRFSGLLHLGDFEAVTVESTQDSLVEVRLQLDITAASPSFLLAPKVPSFQQTSLCEEEREMVTVRCSDGSLCAERTLLMRESLRWKSYLLDPSELAVSIDCAEFSLAEMKVFLFYLQTQLFYDLARFDTFNTMAKIAIRYSVSSVVRRCAAFVNECILLAETSRRTAEASGSGSTAAGVPAAEAPVSSKVRWTPDDLITIWCTTVNHLGEESLGKAIMRLICQSSYTEISRLVAFQQLDAVSRSSFYHHYLLCRETASASSGSRVP